MKQLRPEYSNYLFMRVMRLIFFLFSIVPQLRRTNEIMRFPTTTTCWQDILLTVRINAAGLSSLVLFL